MYFYFYFILAIERDEIHQYDNVLAAVCTYLALSGQTPDTTLAVTLWTRTHTFMSSGAKAVVNVGLRRTD